MISLWRWIWLRLESEFDAPRLRSGCSRLEFGVRRTTGVVPVRNHNLSGAPSRSAPPGSIRVGACFGVRQQLRWFNDLRHAQIAKDSDLQRAIIVFKILQAIIPPRFVTPDYEHEAQER
jgi:hypothetical protein